ncbi:MAG TPA: MFS transporter, partial [Ureibacillus sp.]|nr:MFS transporter [Ureibacillus sp.]
TAPAGIAMVNAFASLGGFVGPMIFGQLAISTGMFTLGTLIILGGAVILTLKKKGLSVVSEKETEVKTIS